MRLIQQKPSWSLHAFLRFNDLRYVSEYTPSFSALGRSLPIIVTGKAVVSEEEAMLFLSEQLSNDGVDHKLSIDGILAKFIKSAIVGCFNQIVRYNGDHRDSVFKASPVGLNLVFASVLDIQDALNKDKFDFLPGASDEELLAHLNTQYKQLNVALQGHENESLSSLVSITKNSLLEARSVSSADALSKRGQADAVLFGHITEVLCNEGLAPVVQKYPALIKFFQNICHTYFAVPFAALNSEQNNWNVALSNLLNNPYITSTRCEAVRLLLTVPSKDGGGVTLTFKSTTAATAEQEKEEGAAVGECRSVLYLNDYHTIDQREVEVHDHASVCTTVTLLSRQEQLPTVRAVVDKSSQVLDNLKAKVGISGAATTNTTAVVDKGMLTNSTVVGVSIGGILYMAVVAACFVGYVTASKQK